MNKLPLDKRVQIVQMLVEGSSMRSTARVVDCALQTVVNLLRELGPAGMEHHDGAMRDVPSRRIQCDEIWAFCYAKRKNVATATAAPPEAGDVWTWTALDPDHKLMVSWLVGGRGIEYAIEFMRDLRSRLTGRVELTTDGHGPYAEAVELAFGAHVDYAQLVKLLRQPSDHPEDGRPYFGTAEYVGERKRVLMGTRDPEGITTSHVERHNLTMRMSMRRYARMTNAFSKRLEQHCNALALYFTWYNWSRPHGTLGTTPAMAAGLARRPMEMAEVVGLADPA